MRLEFSGGKAKCPLCHMEYGGSGLAVHFARCYQMSEEQRRIKTSARIREAGPRRTDSSVEMNDTRGHAKKHLSGVSAKKKEIVVTELQKKLKNMVKAAKDEQMK